MDQDPVWQFGRVEASWAEEPRPNNGSKTRFTEVGADQTTVSKLMGFTFARNGEATYYIYLY